MFSRLSDSVAQKNFARCCVARGYGAAVFDDPRDKAKAGPQRPRSATLVRPARKVDRP